MDVEKVYLQLIDKEEFWEGKRYIVFNISAETVDGDEAMTPVVRYILNNK